MVTDVALPDSEALLTQKTEIGSFPQDWSVSPFCELKSASRPLVKAGPFGSILTKDQYVKEGYKIYGQEQVISGDPFFGDYFIDKRKFNQLKSCSVEPNDVLVSLVGTVGRVLVIPENALPGVINPRLLRISVHPDYISVGYVKYQLESEVFQRSLKKSAQGGTMGVLSAGILKEALFPIPPTLDEQRAIAQALSDADALVEALERLIAKKRLIKQGAMQELLSPKFSWVARALDEVADVIDPHPSHRAPAEYANGVPFLGIGDLSESGEIIGTKLRRVHPSVLDEHAARYNTNDNLIGLGRVASIGKVVRIKPQSESYLISPTLGIIKARFTDPDYIYHYLLSRNVSDQFAKIMSGSTRSSVGMIVLRKLEIKLPPSHEEQTRVATVLSDMDAEISALEAKLAKARQIKQGMMQQLLTGKIRLV